MSDEFTAEMKFECLSSWNEWSCHLDIKKKKMRVIPFMIEISEKSIKSIIQSELLHTTTSYKCKSCKIHYIENWFELYDGLSTNQIFRTNYWLRVHTTIQNKSTHTHTYIRFVMESRQEKKTGWKKYTLSWKEDTGWIGGKERERELNHCMEKK